MRALKALFTGVTNSGWPWSPLRCGSGKPQGDRKSAGCCVPFMTAVGTSATFRDRGRPSGFSPEADIRGLLSVLLCELRPGNERKWRESRVAPF